MLSATVSGGFAVVLFLGAGWRQLLWLFERTTEPPPKGGEWGTALAAVVAWSIAASLAVGANFLEPMAASINIAHGMAKLSCARLGCCGWIRFVDFIERANHRCRSGAQRWSGIVQ